MTSRRKMSPEARGYRSGLEGKVAQQLETLGIKVEYEAHKIPYVVPETKHKYTPDFILPNGIIIETKGRFVLADRKKHLLLQAQRPDLDIRFVFSNSAAKINKGSSTTYADWCSKNGFLYSDKLIPEAWISEKGMGKNAKLAAEEVLKGRT
jgi:hypothetical protein